MNATDALVTQIEKLNVFMRDNDKASVPIKDFEDYYKQLRGIKAWFDTGGTISWDKIESTAGIDWIKDIRKDSVFKEYYKIRREIDRLEVLVK